MVRVCFVPESWPMPPSETDITAGKFVPEMDDIGPEEDDAEYPLHFDITSNGWRYKPTNRNLFQHEVNWHDPHFDFDMKRFAFRSANSFWNTPLSSISKPAKVYSTYSSFPSKEFRVVRIAVDAQDVDCFVSIAGPFVYKKDKQSALNHDPKLPKSNSLLVDTNEHKLFNEIAEDRPVNVFLQKGSGHVGTWSQAQKWSRIAVNPVSAQLVFDITRIDYRLLICDSPKMSVGSLVCAQSELYLLMGLWFDNVFDMQQYYLDPANAPANQVVELNITSTDEFLSDDDGGGIASDDTLDFEHKENGHRRSDARYKSKRRHKKREKPDIHFSQYTSPDYVRFLQDRNILVDIVVLRAELSFGCSIDSNYFPRHIPCHAFLDGLQEPENLEHHFQFERVVAEKSAAGASNASRSKNVSFQAEEKMYTRPRSDTTFRFATQDKDRRSVGNDTNNPLGKWHNQKLPIAKLNISGLFLHAQVDFDVIKISFSAGKLEVFDHRFPSKTLTPLAVQIPSVAVNGLKNALYRSPYNSGHHHPCEEERSLETDGSARSRRGRRRLYGHSDFNYGFNLQTSDIDVAPDLPFKMAFLSSQITNWMTMNIGIDNLDLNLYNYELVHLVSEYFSCYFRFPEYGHPSLQAYSRLDPRTIPFGGTDTRVFFTRPHISIVRFPLSSGSQTLMLESDQGVFLRYVFDTTYNVRSELNLHDVAVILTKKYRPPELSRGLRGAAGSGRGVRTLIEYLNCSYSYHFMPRDNHLDLKFNITNPDFDEDDVRYHEVSPFPRTTPRPNNDYVDLNKDFLNLRATSVPYPHSVYPLIEPKHLFMSNPCDVVTSYEDALFVVSVFKDFFDTRPEEVDDASDIHRSVANAGKQRNTKSKAKTPAQKNNNSKNSSAAPRDPVPSMFCVIALNGLRLMVVDNILGLHLPLLYVSCATKFV